MRQVPWFTLVVAVLFVVSPLGRDLLSQSFESGEQLSRSLGQFLLKIGGAIVVGLAAIEAAIRHFHYRRGDARDDGRA